MSVRDRIEGRHFQAPAPEAPVEQTSVRQVLTQDGLEPIEQDPSMPDRPTVAVPSAPAGPVSVVAPVVAAPAPVVVAPVAELPEKRHEWQPTDENGKPLGGKQVIVYRTEQELIEKMQNNNVLLQRQLRKERRERAIGTEEKVDDAEKFSGVVEFKPRDLTADERFKIAQDLVNPEKFSDARDALVESAFGQKPEVLASTLNDVQKLMIRNRAVENYIDFVNASGFEDSPENREAITGWLGKRNLAPTVANFVIAQNRLREAGLLPEAPAVQQVVPETPTPAVAAPVVTVESNPQTPAAPATRIGGEEQPQAKRQSHVPSGLTPNVASAAGDNTPASGSSLTLADIDKMPSEEYKKRIKDPSFVALVNKLENEAAARRRAKALGQ